MAQPNISNLDPATGQSIYDLANILNAAIAQSIKEGLMVDGQVLRLVTQDGTNNEITLMKARDGIISGMQLAFTGSLTADVQMGNYQCNGKTESVGATTPISFAARHATLPRIDIVYASTISPPMVGVSQGTPDSNPTPPTLSATNAPLHLVWIDPASAPYPNDFIVSSVYVDDPFSFERASTVENGVTRANFPSVPRMNDFDTSAQNWDADRLFVDTSAGPVPMNLPDPTLYVGYEREWLIILDGTASSNNVTIDATAAGAFTINGTSSVTLSTNYQQYRIIARGGAFYGG